MKIYRGIKKNSKEDERDKEKERWLMREEKCIEIIKLKEKKRKNKTDII